MNPSPRHVKKSNLEVAAGKTTHGNSAGSRPTPSVLWPALVALGNGFALAGNQATALELGDANVQSTLGQPLRASIAYALAPKESIYEHCIFLRSGDSANGLPAVRNATARLSDGAIVVTGKLPIREPLLNLHLTVDCPGTANLTRQYSLFIDPAFDLPPVAATTAPAAIPAFRATPATATVPARPARPASEARRAAPAAAPATSERSERHNRPAPAAALPIRGQNSYRVQPGDTLSGIAARISDRDIGIWQAVDRIFAANPQAFIDNNRDLLRAGSLLTLPDLGTVGTVGAVASVNKAAAREPSPANPPASKPLPAEALASAPVAAAIDLPPARESAPHAAADAAKTGSRNGAAARPGDVSVGPDSPFVSPIDTADGAATAGRAFGPAREVIPDTEVDAAAIRRPRNNATVAVGNESDGLGSLAWLGGAGVAIILGLLLFGRRFRERFGSSDDALPAGVARGRRRSDVEPAESPRMDVSPEQASKVAGDSPIQVQPVALDADLGSGSGFDDDSDIDVAQDFGFSTSRDLYSTVDGEFAEDTSAAGSESPTDIIPPHRFTDNRFTDTVIVEKEIPPSDDSGEYDLSMIVDATRQPIADSEETTRDLKAIPVDTGDNEALDVDNYTLSHDVDYKILEQDYEDELTATQALNAKLAKAAAEVTLLAAADMDAEDPVDAPTARFASISDELTMRLPDGDDFDRTAEMPLNRHTEAKQPGDLDDSGLNVEVTTELPAADNDDTVDVEDLGSTTIDTKKLRAS